MSREDRRVADGSRSAGISRAVPVGPELRHDRAPGQSPEIQDAGILAPIFSPPVMGGTAGAVVARHSTAERGAPHNARFALTKFRPTTLPATLLTRPALLGRLEAGASKRLT